MGIRQNDAEMRGYSEAVLGTGMHAELFVWMGGLSMIIRQDIVTWHTPAEKHPPEGIIVVASVSGKKKNITYDHALVLVQWYDDGLGYTLENDELEEFTIHAWCDLEPYMGD